MSNELAEPDSKALLLGIVEMCLVTEEDHLVLEQHLIDGADGLVGKATRQVDIPDLGTKPRRAPDDVRARNDVIDGCRIAHDRVLTAAIPWTKLRHTPVAGTTTENSFWSAGPTRPQRAAAAARPPAHRVRGQNPPRAFR